MPKSRNKRKNREKNKIQKLNEMNRYNNERRREISMTIPAWMMMDEFFKEK